MTDITAAFKLACTAIPIETTVKRPTTALLDAMNAMAFFDPALDTGLTKTEPVSDFSIGMATTDDSERCLIMDKLSQLEASWHLGSSLSDTVYTALYYHHPEGIVDASLQSYVLAYVKCVELVYNEFAKGNVVDGEDVWLDHYGVSIGLADSVEQILSLLDEDTGKEASSRIRKRLNQRKAMLQMFAMPLLPIALPPLPTSDAIEPCPGILPILPYIRQTMPVPPSRLIDPSRYLAKLNSQMQQVNQLSTVADWQSYLQTQSLVPYVRSVAAGKIALIQNAYEQLANVNQAEGIWRSIADGCAIATIRVPLQNRARQRRSYLSLAHSWDGRATAALSANNLPAFRASHAIRLDCLLEAAIASHDLALCHPSEYAQMMWWINCITSLRCTLGANCWAEVWMRISAGMLQKLRATPIAKPASRNLFSVRHKWARKTPYPRRGRGIVPRWEDWERSQDSLELDGTSNMLMAEELLAEGFSHLISLRDEVRINRLRSGNWKRGTWLYIAAG